MSQDDDVTSGNLGLRPVSSRLWVGDTVGDYHLEEKVGEGGFATVFRARDVRSGATVAVKILRPDVVGQGVAVRRFLREAEALAQLRHPNIVQILSVGEASPGQPHLVMEWIAGRSLAQELRERGTFSLDEVLGLLDPLAAALTAAHAIGIIHRDLKPANVMLSPRGDWFDVRLVDFGVAKLLDPAPGEARLTETGMLVGTPNYMAPEQFLGLPVDVYTDVYALGVLTFRLLAGQPPFSSKSQTELSEMHVSVAPPPVSAFVSVPRTVDEVLARALAKRPAQRYSSAREMVEALHRAMTDDPARGEAPAWIAVRVTSTFAANAALTDELVARVDAALDLATDVLAGAGMEFVPAAGSGIVARRTTERRASTVRRVADVAMGLHARLAETCPPRTGVAFSVAVHAANDARGLDDARWGRPEDGALTVSDAVAPCLDDDCLDDEGAGSSATQRGVGARG